MKKEYRYFKPLPPNAHKDWDGGTKGKSSRLYIVNENKYGSWNNSSRFEYHINYHELCDIDWKHLGLYYYEITKEEAFIEML